MKAVDRLTDAQVLALARFIAGCARVRSSARWRTRFAECARRGHFLPYVALSDQQQLIELVRYQGESVVCGLRAIDILQAGNQVAQVWGEPAIELPPACAAQPAASPG